MVKNKKITKTKSQNEALQKLDLFLKKPINVQDINSYVFLMKGKAGTGKTTIVYYALEKKILDDQRTIDKDSSPDFFAFPNVVGVALSHTAKNVLSKSIHVCATFASCYGLKQKFHDDGSITFEKPKWRNKMLSILGESPVGVFVHDEVSTYDQGMLDHVLEFTGKHSKIIFMGDPGQSPPITGKADLDDDKDSPVFYLDLLESNVHTLTERVRQTEDNPIIELSDIIYEEIFGNKDMLRVYNAMKNDNIINGKGHKTICYKDFLSDFESLATNYTQTKVIAYTNVRVNMLNSIIRKRIYKNSDFPYLEGELIYMKDSYSHKILAGAKTVLTKWICYNSDEYKILRVTKSKVDEVNVYNLYLDKTGHMHLSQYKDPYIPVVCESGKFEFNKTKNQLHYFASIETLNKGYKYKVLNDFVQKFSNISYGYCYTTYKIQGRGYKNIYIDVNNILTVTKLSPKRKLQAIYTGLTRATDLAVFLKANQND